MNPDPACMLEEFVLLSNRLLLIEYFDGELTLQTRYRKRDGKTKYTERGKAKSNKTSYMNLVHRLTLFPWGTVSYVVINGRDPQLSFIKADPVPRCELRCSTEVKGRALIQLLQSPYICTNNSGVT